jgi:hypothetical protein
MRIFSIKENGEFEEFSQTHFHVDHEESVLGNWLESEIRSGLTNGYLQQPKCPIVKKNYFKKRFFNCFHEGKGKDNGT